MSDFGEVRSLLHDVAPSAEAFARLLGLFRGAPDAGEARRVWMPYALEHLKEWPGEFRRIVLSGAEGGDGVWLPLAEALEIDCAAWKPNELEGLLTSSRLTGLAELKLMRVAERGVFGWLAASDHVGSLRRLRVGGRSVRIPTGCLDGAKVLRLDTLELSGCRIGGEGLEELSRSFTMAGLRVLDVSHCAIDGRGVRALARSEYLTRLRSLDLCSNALEEGDLDEWASVEGRASFERLNVGHVPLGDRALATLVRSGRLDGARSLALGWSEISGEGVEVLLREADLARLVSLGLHGVPFGKAECSALSSARLPELEELEVEVAGASDAVRVLRVAGMPSLRCLRFSAPGSEVDEPFEEVEDLSEPCGLAEVHFTMRGVTEAAMSALVATRRMRGVDMLLLCSNAVDVDAARALGSGAATPSLGHIDLEGCQIGDEGLEALLGGREFEALRVLDLSLNGLTDASSGVLPRAGLEGLERLVVNDNLVGAEWVEALVVSPVSASLDVLDLMNTLVGDEGVVAIGESPHLRALEELCVCSDGVGASGLRALLGSEAMWGLKSLDVRRAAFDDGVALEFAASPSVATLSLLCLDFPSWGVEAWSAFVRSPNLRALEELYVDSMELTPALYEALGRARSERVTLNPWTKRYVEV